MMDYRLDCQWSGPYKNIMWPDIDRDLNNGSWWFSGVDERSWDPQFASGSATSGSFGAVGKYV